MGTNVYVGYSRKTTGNVVPVYVEPPMLTVVPNWPMTALIGLASVIIRLR